MAADLVKTPAFDRAKRAMQVFSSALFLLAISTSSAAIKPEALGAAVTISTASLQAILWVVSTYYAVIFAVEYRTATTFNSEGLVKAPGATIDTRMEHIENEAVRATEDFKSQDASFGMLVSTVKNTLARISGVADGLSNIREVIASINQALVKYPEVYDPQFNDMRSVPENIEREIRDVVKDSLAPSISEVLQSVENLSASLESFSKASASVESDRRTVINELSAIKNDLRAVSREISSGQRFVFRWLDFWASFALYGLATICTIVDRWSAIITFLSAAIHRH